MDDLIAALFFLCLLVLSFLGIGHLMEPSQINTQELLKQCKEKQYYNVGQTKLICSVE